jgi:DNA-directed RNA polymerase specialized sigma24 family protein
MSEPRPFPAAVRPASARPQSIEELLSRSGEPIRRLLAEHSIPPADTEELLLAALLVLVYRWQELGDPEAWLLATLRNHCRRYWRQRGGGPSAGGGPEGLDGG